MAFVSVYGVGRFDRVMEGRRQSDLLPSPFALLDSGELKAIRAGGGRLCRYLPLFCCYLLLFYGFPLFLWFFQTLFQRIFEIFLWFSLFFAVISGVRVDTYSLTHSLYVAEGYIGEKSCFTSLIVSIKGFAFKGFVVP
jgi:hypothetical protein